MKRTDKDLLLEFVKTDFTLRYNNSILGFLWVVIKPLLIFTVMYIVFSLLLGNTVKFYALYLLLGTIMYTFFQEITINGLNSLLQKKDMMLKVNFKRYLAVVGSSLIAVVNFTFNLVVIIIFFAFNHILPSPLDILIFLFGIVILYILGLAISFSISILHVLFRDLQHIWDIFMLVLFYLTPIVYPLSLIKGKTLYLIDANPLTHIFNFTREALIYNKIESVYSTLIIFIISVVFLYFSYRFFSKKIMKIAEDF
jgi:ABC-type polysaccharide/polyol phosphate export permease